MNQVTETRILLEEFYQQVRNHLENSGEYKKGFNTINNKIALCNKIFDAKDIKFQNNEEGLEAIKLLLRDFLFIGIMSTFEHSFLTIFPHAKAPKTSEEMQKAPSVRHIAFSKLVEWLKIDELLDNIALWKFAISVRNDFVHFDSHARTDLVSPEPDIKMFANRDEVIKGEMISIVKLLQKLELEFFELVKKLRA